MIFSLTFAELLTLCLVAGQLATKSRDSQNENDSEINSEYLKMVQQYKADIRQRIQKINLDIIGNREYGVNELTMISKEDKLRLLRWKNDVILLKLCERKVSMALITFQNEVSLHQFFNFTLQNYGHSFDKFEALIHNDKLWIFETSTDSDFVFVNSLRMDSILVPLTKNQGVLARGKVGGLHPFVFRDNVHLLILSTSRDGGMIFAILSNDKSTMRVIMESYLRLNIEEPNIKHILYEDHVYFFIYNEIFVIYKYDGSSLTFVKEGNCSNVFAFKDEKTREFTFAVLQSQKIETYSFKGEEFRFVEESSVGNFIRGMSKGSEHGRILLMNETRVSIYKKKGEGKFSLEMTLEKRCNHLENTFVIEKGNGIYLLLHCRDLHSGSIKFERGIIPPTSSELQMDYQVPSKTEKCLNEILLKLRKNKYFINGFLKVLNERNILGSSRDKTIIDEPVNLKSTEVSNELNGKNLEIVPTKNFINTIKNIEDIRQEVNLLNSKTTAAETKLSNLLTFTKDQHVTAAINVKRMIANDSNILSIDVEEINDVLVEDYKTKYLVLDKDQVLNSEVNFDKIITKNAKSDFLLADGIKLSSQDLMKTNKIDQVVTGNYSFSSMEVRNDVYRVYPTEPILINHLSTDDMVYKHSDVSFQSTKTFYMGLKAQEFLNLEHLNGVNFDLWRDSLVKKRDLTEFPVGASVTIRGNMNVSGNVKATSINGMNIKELFESAAKRGSNEQIFKGEIIVDTLTTKNLKTDRVNNILWKDLLRLENSETQAKFYIDEGIVFQDLNCPSINGLNLRDNVLNSVSNQTIYGKLTFTESVSVVSPEGVTMSSGATINDVDPSLFSLSLSSRSNVVSQKVNLAQVLEISGDAQISEINGKSFPRLDSNYWLKSVPQRIPQTTSLKNANFKNSLHCLTFNDDKLSSYLTKSSKQTLTEGNYFMKNVRVLGETSMKNGKTFGGTDLSLLKENALHLYGKQTIHGGKSFLEELVINDLTLDYESDNDLNKLVRIHQFEGVPFYSGNITFKNEILVDTFKVSENMKVENINGRNSIPYLSQKRTVSEIHGNLYLRNVNVDKLVLTEKLNGKYFGNWIQNTFAKGQNEAFLEKGVFVKGDVTFNGYVDVDIVNSRPLRNFTEMIATKCKDCKVFGHKRFLEPIEVARDLNVEFINGFNLNAVREKLLSRSKPQVIEGIFNFAKGITADSAELPQINEIPLKDIILKNKAVKFTNPVIFTSNTVFTEIKSKEGWIDNCDPKRALESSKHTKDNLTRSSVSVGRIKVKGDVTLDEKFPAVAGNVDVLYFLRNVFTKSRKQYIYGPTQFKGDAFVSSLTSGSINDISTTEFLRLLSKNYSQVETNCSLALDKLVSKTMIVDDFISSFLNEDDLVRVARLGIRKNNGELITGIKVFRGANIYKNLITPGIGNILFEDLLSYDSSGEASIYFQSPVSFNDILVKGTIGGEKPEKLLSAFNQDEKTLSLPKKAYSYIVKGSLITEYINDLNLNEVFQKSQRFNKVRGTKVVLGGTFVDGDVYIDNLNDINVRKILELPLVESERAARHISEDASETGLKSSLEKIAYLAKTYNSLNLKYIKASAPKLLYVTEDDEITLVDKLIVNSLRSNDLIDLSVNIRNEDCQNWMFCPCLQTRKLKINNESKLEFNSNYVKGLNIPVIIRGNKSHLYNFNIRCSDREVNTFVSHLNFDAEGREHLVTTNKLSLGGIKEVLALDDREKRYLIFLTHPIGEEFLSLQVKNVQLGSIWDYSLYLTSARVVLKQIRDAWYLLLIDNSSTRNNTRMLIWNREKEKFVPYGIFPPALIGDIIVRAKEAYLLLAEEESYFEKCLPHQRRLLKVYKVSESLHFEQFSSVPASGVKGLASFEVGGSLYIAVTSDVGNVLEIHRLVQNEGFVKEYTHAMSRPSEIVYRGEKGQHYLVVASANRITLLRIHFGGFML